MCDRGVAMAEIALLSLVVLVVGSRVAPSLIGTFNAVSAGSLADTDPQPGASYDRAAQPPWE